MKQFLKNGLIGLFGFFAADTVLLVAYMLRENSFLRSDRITYSKAFLLLYHLPPLFWLDFGAENGITAV